jgi:hypothetical protein
MVFAIQDLSDRIKLELKYKKYMPKKIKFFTVAIIVLVGIVLILETFFIVLTFRILKNYSSAAIHYPKSLHKKKISLENIQDWMTFDFINKSFKLPSEYLKTKLGVSDAKYPNIAIDHWAKENKKDPAAVVNEIKKLILDYQNANSVSSTNII